LSTLSQRRTTTWSDAAFLIFVEAKSETLRATALTDDIALSASLMAA